MQVFEAGVHGLRCEGRYTPRLVCVTCIRKRAAARLTAARPDPFNDFHAIHCVAIGLGSPLPIGNPGVWPNSGAGRAFRVPRPSGEFVTRLRHSASAAPPTSQNPVSGDPERGGHLSGLPTSTAKWICKHCALAQGLS
jgi:hypothetical protein